MADYPDLTIWTDAYIGDTGDLTFDQHGAYYLMLLIAWRRPDCALPADLDEIKRILASKAKFHGHTFNSVVPNILERFWFKGADGKWRQKRLLEEREARLDLSTKASQSARKRWSNRAQTALKGLEQTLDPVAKHRQPAAETLHSANAIAQPSQSDRYAPHPTLPIKKEDSLTSHGEGQEEEPILTAEQRLEIAKRLGADLEKLGLKPAARTNGSTPAFAPKAELPTEHKLARFQQWLAPLVGGGWLTINAAFDPENPDHKTALNACKTVAKNNGKGWPLSAPQ